MIGYRFVKQELNFCQNAIITRDEEGSYYMNYIELIAPIISVLQDCLRDINLLKEKCNLNE